MSSNQFLIDAASRHAVFLQRYSAGLEQSAVVQIKRAFDAMIGFIASNEIEGISAARFESIQREALAIFQENIGTLSERIKNELGELLISEAEFTFEMLSQGVKGDVSQPPPDQLELAFSLGRMDLDRSVSIDQALQKFGTAKANQVRQIIRDGFTEGTTSQQLVRKLRDVIPLQSNQIQSLVRTATNSTSSIARMQTMMENSGLFDGYEWVATLDNRTSFLCMSRDGIIYPFASSSPMPPAHWGCRSTIIPKVKRQFDLLAEVEGVRPSVGASGAQEVGAKTAYGGWLKSQPASFQNEVLGETRAKLFRLGELKIDQFIDNSGRTYTLAQLRALNPLAFERAGL